MLDVQGYKLKNYHIPEAAIARFWAKVDKTSSPYGCWLWTAGTDNGYGSFGVSGFGTFMAHRLAWFLVKGKKPKNFTLHRCPQGSDRLCVNPDHTYDGTKKDNALDRSREGRSYRPFGKRNPSRTHPHRRPRGERHGNAKLNEKIVPVIRSLYRRGFTEAFLARRYNVSAVAISKLILRKTWTHV